MKALLIVAVVVSLFAGVGIGAAYYSLVLAENTASYTRLVDELRAENNRLQSQLAASNSRVSSLESDIKAVQALLDSAERRAREFDDRVRRLESQVQQLTDENSAVRKELETLRAKSEAVKNVMARLENDRVLLSWVRAEPPSEREAARQYWNETRSLSLKSDPNLALTVDKILASLDLYFDWLEKAPPLTGTSRAEIIAWCPLYIDWILNAPPGVDEYSNAIQQFADEMLLVVIGHIDSLMTVLEG
ncbi:MAG: hypothetical protein NZ941_08095 [Candidatus Caldarchaeum sp.]|nr:hypothetical protein [Candidatus Caldarchaeum sp.]